MPRGGQGFVVVTEGNRIPVLEGIPTLSADEYLEGVGDSLAEDLVVLNLCRSYQYLSKGYYVSLLADARQQRVFPALKTIEEIRNPATCLRALRAAGVPVADARTVRELRRAAARAAAPAVVPVVVPAAPLGLALPAASHAGAGDNGHSNGNGNGNGHTPGSVGAGELAENGASTLAGLPETGYAEAWSVFGETVDRRFKTQCAAAFGALSFPLLKVRFYCDGETWKAAHVAPVAVSQLDPGELQLLSRALERPRFLDPAAAAARPHPYRIACLWDAQDPFAASDRDTLDHFERIAAKSGMSFERIGLDDLPRLAEYDALFIRTVTAIDHPSFTFAQMAESLGIPVIDDPRSILRCTNKVFMNELFTRHGVHTPRTATISRKTSFESARKLGFPLIVKLPDGTFSQSVKKADDLAQFDAITQEMFRRSPLLIIQEFTPTDYDWRIGVLENRVLFAAKYHMAQGHWQIVSTSQSGEPEYGPVEAVRIADVPAAVLALALETTALLGDGLYGVDIKDTASGPAVIEVNDNPSIHQGCEDEIEGDRLYETVLGDFAKRIRQAARAQEHA